MQDQYTIDMRAQQRAYDQAEDEQAALRRALRLSLSMRHALINKTFVRAQIGHLISELRQFS